MTPIEITLTNAGLQALVNAQANGTAAVAITSYGISEAALAPTPDMTTLLNERKRVGTVSGGIVSLNTIHVVLQDTGDDAYTLRAFALYLSDGTLFGIYGQADPILIKTAGADMLIATDIQFVNTDVTNIAFGSTNFFNPPATETVVGVARIATQGETNAGADDRTIVTPKKLAGAGLAKLTGATFTGAVSAEGQMRINASGIGATAFWAMQPDSMFVLYAGYSNPIPVAAYNVNASGAFGFTVQLAVNGNKVWHAGNDGAGSGLDADILAGQTAGFYTDIPARLGYTPVRQGGGPGQNGNVINIGWNGSRLRLAVDGSDQGNVLTEPNASAGTVGFNGTAMRRNGFDLWGPDNDGAGSGLDADLLDGLDSGYYTNIVARLGYNPANRAGDTFTGDVSVAHPGDAALTVNSSGVVIGTIVAQADGNIVMYRNNGAGRVPIWASDGVYFNAALPIMRQGNKVWDSGNDGAGSGLDADLLAGQGSGYYTDIVARLGYTPANKAGETFDGEVSAQRFRARSNGDGKAVSIGDDAWIGDGNITSGIAIRGQANAAEGYVAFGNTTTPLGCYANDATLRYGGNTVWHAGNDGAGSGLDADLLDGQDSAYYTNITGRLGYTPANRAGDTFTGAVEFSAGLTRQGNTVWDAGNDGSGSGLDADLLDGRDASSFASAGDFGFGANDNGYWEKRPNGVIEQWGTAAGRTSEGAVQINFPIAFTDQASVRVFPVGVNVNSNNRYDVIVQRVLITANGATVYCQWSANDNSSAILDGVDWRAIGR